MKDAVKKHGGKDWAAIASSLSIGKTELTSAVTNTRKKKSGKEHKIDWVAVAAHIPGRTGKQLEEMARCTKLLSFCYKYAQEKDRLGRSCCARSRSNGKTVGGDGTMHQVVMFSLNELAM
jgi:hypothetical protein